MAYLISDIKGKLPEKDCKYLFDANIWFAVLYDYYNRPAYIQYVSFFNKIIENKPATYSRIALPGLLISELINRVIKDIFYGEFKLANPDFMSSGKTFKDYRNSEQHKTDRNIVTSEIRSYNPTIEFVSDNLSKYTAKQLIRDIPNNFDFNDFIFSKIAKEQNLTIVTNDSDFIVEDIRIYTTQNSLLDLSKAKD